MNVFFASFSEKCKIYQRLKFDYFKFITVTCKAENFLKDHELCNLK